ncbi:DUF2795 domain-containing protein [Myceligenerans xiligouense]|uniref:DUF2795 domain-containing protein n=1 Tax=Myceligenerans xiligouense TaxID=253184 RepID=UPI0014768470|nr:DUF2795 domain-containing protein [Myceligenerans xiligouense]
MARVQIADLVADAFGPSGAHRSEILAAAVAGGGSPELLAELERLPDRTFATMRDLWDHLPDVPIRLEP